MVSRGGLTPDEAVRLMSHNDQSCCALRPHRVKRSAPAAGVRPGADGDIWKRAGVYWFAVACGAAGSTAQVEVLDEEADGVEHGVREELGLYRR